MYPYEIGGFITLYGILVGAGVLACFIVFWCLAKKDKLESRYTDFITVDGVVTAAAGFGFAALFQSIYSYIENPEAGFGYNGLTFYGGLIGGAAVFVLLAFLFRKRYQSKMIDIVGNVPLGILIGHAFGRVGCFMAGCCYGKPTTSPIGVQFTDLETGGLTEKVIPTNLIEAVFLFIVFGILLAVYLKKAHPYNLPLYMILYGIFRFVIEYFRDDDRGEFVPGMSPSQFWSVILVIGGVILIPILGKLWAKRQAYLKEHPIVEPREKKKTAKQK